MPFASRSRLALACSHAERAEAVRATEGLINPRPEPSRAQSCPARPVVSGQACFCALSADCAGCPASGVSCACSLLDLLTRQNSRFGTAKGATKAAVDAHQRTRLFRTQPTTPERRLPGVPQFLGSWCTFAGDCLDEAEARGRHDSPTRTCRRVAG